MADQKTKDKITRILKAKFPTDTVDISDGYANNIHIIVVSREFQEMNEAEKVDFIWDLLEDKDLPKADKLTRVEKSKISRVSPWSPSELK